MNGNFDDKTPANQMRILLNRLRGVNVSDSSSSVNGDKISMRDLLKKTRMLNENIKKGKIHEFENKKTVYDENKEKEKFLNFFDDLNVAVDFIDLEIYDNVVFWGGTINGVIQFVYKVTPYENMSGVEFNYLKGFSPDNPENEEIIERVEKYYDIFYKYWRDNILQ